jgi:hypothetical protein
MTSTRTLTFLEFCERIGVRLTPAQRVLCAVSYDGIEPEWLVEKKDRELARTLFGDIAKVPQAARSVAVNLCGARGGKSYVLSALRLLHLALTVPLDSLAPNEHASALIVAPNLKLARQTYRFVLGAAQHKMVATRLIGKPGKESFIIGRENGRMVVVECLPATRGGAAVRARNYVGAALDEFAFFRSEDYTVNDGEIFRAVTPRILPGGQTIISSTAWARLGMMYELFQKNWGKPGTCVAAKAPTILLNPSKKAEIEIERDRDPVNAAREFDCQFMDAGIATFFSHDAIEKAVDDSLVLPLKPPPGSEIMIGADLGFRRDSSALVVVYKLPDGRYIVAEILELRPTPGEPLKPSFVVEEFAKACKRHECTWLQADQHYRETLDEELAKHNLSYMPAPAGAEGKSACHMATKAILHSGKLTLPPNKRLIEQMKGLIGKPLAGGGLSLQSPRTALGGHGDILSALVLAVSQKAGQRSQERIADKPITLEEAIKKQTAEVWRRYEEKRMEALAAQQEAEGPSEGWSIHS